MLITYPTYKLIIAGSRNFNNYDFVELEINKIIEEKTIVPDLTGNLTTRSFNITNIISGGANGVDKLGEMYAKEYEIPCIVYSAKWDKYGKSAGPIRNIEMANAADALIAFWDGKSRGTKHMIDAMLERKKEVHIISI